MTEEGLANIANYRRALAANPNSIELHCRLAVALQQQGQLEAAIASYQRALALKPDLLPAYVNLAHSQQALGQLDAAATNYLHALNLMPNSAELHCYLAATLQKKGQLEAAALSYQRALALQPNLAVAHINLAQLLRDQGEFGAAIASYRQALALDANNADVHTELGIALGKHGELDAAIISHRSALALRPNSAAAHVNLGVTLYQHGAYSEAIEHYRQALALEPNLTVAHNNLGATLTQQGELSAAVTSYRNALALQSNFPSAYCNLSSVLKDQGNVEEAITCLQRALALQPNYIQARSDYLIALQYLADYPRQKLFAEHLAFADRFEAPLRAHWQAHANSRDPQRRIKIGFVSGDLRTHPVGFFLLNVLRHMNRHTLDITLYSNNSISDNVTVQLRELEYNWSALDGLSDDAAAQRIRADGIDILIDLSGHTGGNRLLVFARKPAPVQVNWLGYWATSGLQAIGYILCDEQSIPADEAKFFVEQPWYLPATRLCFTPPSENIAVDTLPALNNGYVTFGCFNNHTKMTEAIVALWAQILLKVANSRLFLKSNALRDPTIQQSVIARFAAHGIGADRLLLEGYSERASYFAAYNRVDISLDPFPFTGATTSIDGIWMGVPLITRRGDRLVAHQGESILHNLAMVDWIADNDEAYIAQAVARANDLANLAELRGQLRARLLASPLCDAPRFARDLEHALRGMWQRWCESIQPATRVAE